MRGAAGRNFISRCEDLQRSRHIEQLNRRVAEYLDAPGRA